MEMCCHMAMFCCLAVLWLQRLSLSFFFLGEWLNVRCIIITRLNPRHYLQMFCFSSSFFFPVSDDNMCQTLCGWGYECYHCCTTGWACIKKWTYNLFKTIQHFGSINIKLFIKPWPDPADMIYTEPVKSQHVSIIFLSMLVLAFSFMHHRAWVQPRKAASLAVCPSVLLVLVPLHYAYNIELNNAISCQILL